MDFLGAMRQALSVLHQQIEQTPFAQSMVSGRLSKIDYLRLLGQMGLIHEALENALLAQSSLPTALLAQAHLDRKQMIERDLKFWEENTAEPFAPTTRLLQQIQQASSECPESLLGCLYVLEGSRMGAMYLVRPLAAGLGVATTMGQGLDYYVDGLTQQPATWKAFKVAMADLDLSSQQQAAIIQAAMDTMQALLDLYQELQLDVDHSTLRPTANKFQLASS